MVLRSFFDASNKADSRQYDYLCLASVSAPEYLWTPFEEEWQTNLFKYCASYLHMTDAMGQHGIYASWKPIEIYDFLVDCVAIAKRHIAMPATSTDSGRFGLFPYVVSLSLKDLASAKLAPGVARNGNEICIRQSLHSCLDWGQIQAACKEYILYFDRGEPFYGYAKAVWESKKARKDIPLLSQIIGITEMNMRSSSAMQLADLYGWAVSHFHDNAKADWHQDILYPYSGQHIDKSILEQNAIAPEIWANWKIPKRRETP